MLVAVVRELQRDAEVPGAEHSHISCRVSRSLVDYAHGVALDGGLGLQLGVLDEGGDLPGVLDGNALLQLDLLADAGTGGGLELFMLDVLEGDAALDELLAQNFFDRLELVLVLRASWMTVAPSISILDLESLRSKRALISLVAWSTALLTSGRSTLLTTSKVLSAMWAVRAASRFKVRGLRWGGGGVEVGGGGAASCSRVTLRSAARRSAVWSARQARCAVRGGGWGRGMARRSRRGGGRGAQMRRRRAARRPWDRSGFRQTREGSRGRAIAGPARRPREAVQDAAAVPLADSSASRGPEQLRHASAPTNFAWLRAWPARRCGRGSGRACAPWRPPPSGGQMLACGPWRRGFRRGSSRGRSRRRRSPARPVPTAPAWPASRRPPDAPPADGSPRWRISRVWAG